MVYHLILLASSISTFVCQFCNPCLSADIAALSKVSQLRVSIEAPITAITCAIVIGSVEELRNTELQEYLVSDIHENNLQQTYEIESEKDLVFLSLYKKKDDSKYVSEKTNLAKVFYLQDKKSFIERNQFYYYTVRRKFIKAQLEKNTKEKEDAAQSTWDDYL